MPDLSYNSLAKGEQLPPSVVEAAFARYTLGAVGVENMTTAIWFEFPELRPTVDSGPETPPVHSFDSEAQAPAVALARQYVDAAGATPANEGIERIYAK